MAVPGPMRTPVATGLATGASLAATMPTHVAGDAIFVVLSTWRADDPAVDISTPANWTLVNTNSWFVSNAQGVRSSLYRLTNPAVNNATPSPTFNFTVAGTATSVTAAAGAFAVPGCDTTDPVNVVGNNISSAAVTSVSFPSITTTEAECLRVGLHGATSDRTSTSTDFTERLDFMQGTSGPCAWVGDAQQVAAGASGAKAATLSAASGYVCFHVALRPPRAVDTTAPTITLRNVNGTTLTLQASEALNTAKVPAPSAFTVKVNGVARTVSTVAITNTGPGGVGVITLTLASPVTAGQTVTVSYVQPS